MRLSDITRISWRGIANDKKRSFFIIVIMGIVFAVIFMVLFWFNGLKDVYSSLAGNKTYIIVDDSEISHKEITEYGGEIISEANYNGDYFLNMPKDLLLDYVEIDSIPENVTPILINDSLAENWLSQNLPQYTQSFERRMSVYQDFRTNTIGKTFKDGKYLVVGFIPDGFSISNLSYETIQRGKWNMLDSVLEKISTPSAPAIALDGDAINVQTERFIAVFDSDKIYDFYRKGHGQEIDSDLPGKSYYFSIIVGLSPLRVFQLNVYQTILDIFCGILAFLSLIIIIFTFSRVIDYDEKNIRLYHSLGASHAQTNLFYSARFLLITILAALFALLLSFGAILIYHYLEGQNLSDIFTLAFSLPSPKTIFLCGWGTDNTIFLVILLLSPFVVALINQRKL